MAHELRSEATAGDGSENDGASRGARTPWRRSHAAKKRRSACSPCCCGRCRPLAAPDDYWTPSCDLPCSGPGAARRAHRRVAGAAAAVRAGRRLALARLSSQEQALTCVACLAPLLLSPVLAEAPACAGEGGLAVDADGWRVTAARTPQMQPTVRALEAASWSISAAGCRKVQLRGSRLY